MHSKFSTLGMLCNAYDDMPSFSARSKHQRCYNILNRVPSKSVPKTPYELWTGRVPSLNTYVCGGALLRLKKITQTLRS